MEPARGASCPSGQRRGPVAPGEDTFPSLVQKSFHISTTPTIRGRKRRSLGTTPPRKVWKPQSNWVVADWLGRMPAGGEGCPSGQGRGWAAHGEVKVPSPDKKFFHISTNSNKPGTKTVIPRVDTAPHGVETPTQGTPLLMGVREASGPHPMGARSSASSLTVIKYCTATCF